MTGISILALWQKKIREDKKKSKKNVINRKSGKNINKKITKNNFFLQSGILHPKIDSVHKFLVQEIMLK